MRITYKRPTFFSHFTFCLALAGGAFFAWIKDVPQTIWRDDASMMTSVIVALLVFTAARLGTLAWQVDDYGKIHPKQWVEDVDISFGHLAERLSVMLGYVGTAIGLSLQAVALSSGPASFGALATSLFTTAIGGAAAIAIALMTHNLEVGIGRCKNA